MTEGKKVITAREHKKLILEKLDKEQLLDDMAYLEQRIIDLEEEVRLLQSLLNSKQNAIKCLQGD